MKHLKKIVALLFCIMLITIQITVFADSNGTNAIYSTFNVELHRNRVFSQYGVTVYFDGIQVTHLDQGDILTFGAYMADNRAHVLKFDPDKEGVPDRIWTISNLQHGSVITCEIQSKFNQVKIMSQSLSQNGQSLFSIAPDIEGQVKLLGTILATGIGVYQAAN